MPAAATRRPPAARFAVAPAVLLAAAVALAAEQPEAPKAAPPPPVGSKLTDGPGDRVLLTPQEHQKLLDQIDRLKKQLAARKAVPPGEYAVRARVEKRGETTVAALHVTVTFRTTVPNSAVSLGGKKAFLVAATLNGNRLPVLDATEDGFAALIETPGEHIVTLDLEAPVGGRGAKTEVGFDLGLPRAPITKLVLDPPPRVGRVNLTTHAPDPAQPGKALDRRVPALDVKALAPRPGHAGYPLGPVEAVEVSWEPPAAGRPADAARSADVTVICLVARDFVETTATFQPGSPAPTWRFAAPASASVSVSRAAPPAGTVAEPGPVGTPTVTKPTDAGKPVWAVEFPAGTSAPEWVVTAVVRTPRPEATDPKYKGPFAVGPFAALDVTRQTGKVQVTAPANTRLIVRHGPELRQEVPPNPAPDTVAAEYFQFSTGPTGAVPPGPLLTVEAQPLPEVVAVRPAYRFTLTEAGWRVRAELRVFPIRTAVGKVTLDLPAGWRGPEVSPPELVAGVQTASTDAARHVLEVQLAAEHRQPFDLVLTAAVPVPQGAHDAAVPLPRFPGATERDAAITAMVPEGLEVRGAGHAWDGDQPAAWGEPLTPTPGPDGKPPKAATSAGGKFDRGLARVDLAWSAYRPPLAAEVRAEVSILDNQVVVSQRVRLRSPDGLPRQVRFHGGASLRAVPPLDRLGPAEWTFTPPPDAKDAPLALDYVVPLPPRPADGGAWKVPVGLLWPAGATRTETVVRVWARSDAPRAVVAEPGAWRELPPEPMADRDALPALTLAGAGEDLPLVLDVRDATDTPGAGVWVERGLVQVGVGDDGTTRYRARFLLKRWLTDAVEVRLPGAAGSAFEVSFGDPPLKANATATTDGPDRVLRVRLPEAKAGRTPVLEVRYQLPAGGDDAEFTPPRPRAVFAGPVRWQVTVPGGEVPLAAGGGRAVQRWRPRGGMFTPAGPSADDVERWFQTGAELNDGAGPGESVVLRAAGAEAVRVYHVPRTVLTVACSVALLLIGLVVVRLPGSAAGPVAAVLAGVAAVAAVLEPQPAGQAAAAAQPGLAALALVLLGQAAVRWYYHRRVTHLPGFARGRAVDVDALPSSGSAPSARSRRSANGSTGAADPGLPLGSQPSAPAGR